MIEVSLSELRAFIQAQRADRPVRENESGFYSKTGSFLVHYGKDKGWEFNYMVYKEWVSHTKANGIVTIAKMKGESYWLSLFAPGGSTGKTYGELQQALL